MVNNYNCKNCGQEDSDRMVQCDHCDMWYHFDCVGVNSGVADDSWNCKGCKMTFTAPSTTATTPLISNPPIESSDNLLNQPQAMSSPAYVHAEQQKASSTSVRPIMDMQVSTDVPRPSASIANGIDLPIYTTAKQHKQVSNLTLTHNPHHVPITTTPPSFNNDIINHTTNVELQLKMLEEQQRAHQDFIERKYKILSQLGEGAPPPQSSNVFHSSFAFGGPSSAQLAARHAISKHLPYFNGDPEEWPLFISSFKISTAVAGYSNAENLMRLQSCLNGKARELVRSKLMLPAMVPEIIQTNTDNTDVLRTT